MNLRAASFSIGASWLPSEQDIVNYEKRGWCVCPVILPEALLDAARAAIEAQHRGHRDRLLPISNGFSDWQPGDGEGLRNNEFCSLQNDGVASLVLQPMLGAIAARLARSLKIRLFDDQAVYKPPNAVASETAVGWHTDQSYWSTCSSTRMLTAWIPLQDSNAENGTLCVVDGSHRWSESEGVRGFNNPDLQQLEVQLQREIPRRAVIPINLRKGQVSFHHMRTLHASLPNTSSRARFAVAVHLQDEANHYQPFVTPDGNTVVLPHDRLCRRGANGLPDYADSAVFPVIWPAVNQAVHDD